ncbi:hypothetical protein, partial [Arthrobacter sp. DR-2P]
WLRNRNPCCCQWLPQQCSRGWAGWCSKRSRLTASPVRTGWRVRWMKRPGSGSARWSARRAS